MTGTTALARRKAKLGPDARKRISLEIGARVALGDGRAQRGHLRFVPLLAELLLGECLGSGAQGILDVRRQARRDTGLGEAREVCGQVGQRKRLGHGLFPCGYEQVSHMTPLWSTPRKVQRTRT